MIMNGINTMTYLVTLLCCEMSPKRTLANLLMMMIGNILIITLKIGNIIMIMNVSPKKTLENLLMMIIGTILIVTMMIGNDTWQQL